MAKKKNRPPKLPGGAGVQVEFGDEEKELFLKHLEEGVPDKDELMKEGFVSTRSGNKAKARPKKADIQGNVVSIDLHGLTEEQAENKIREQVAGVLRGQRTKLRIITGRGRHSGPGGPVLAVSIHQYVLARFGAIILDIEASPADTTMDGLTFRGHFHVTILKK